MQRQLGDAAHATGSIYQVFRELHGHRHGPSSCTPRFTTLPALHDGTDCRAILQGPPPAPSNPAPSRFDTAPPPHAPPAAEYSYYYEANKDRLPRVPDLSDESGGLSNRTYFNFVRCGSAGAAVSLPAGSLSCT